MKHATRPTESSLHVRLGYESILFTIYEFTTFQSVTSVRV